MLLFHPSPSQLSWILLILLGHRFKSVDFPNLMTASNSADYHVTIFIFRWWYFESLEQFQEEALPKPPCAIHGPLVAKAQPIFLSFELLLPSMCKEERKQRQRLVYWSFIWNKTPMKRNCNYWFFSLEQYSFVSHFVFWAMYLWIIHFEVTTDFVCIHI